MFHGSRKITLYNYFDLNEKPKNPVMKGGLTI